MSQVTENANETSYPLDEDPGSYFYLFNVAIECVDDLDDPEDLGDTDELDGPDDCENLDGVEDPDDLEDLGDLSHLDELVDEGEDEDEELSPDISDLWVRDTEDLDDGRCYPLVGAMPNRWEVLGAIKLPVHVTQIRCEVYRASGQLHSIIGIDCSGFGTLGTRVKEASRKIMEADCDGKSGIFPFKLAIAYELGTSAPDGGLAAHINACSCSECILGLGYTPRAIETLQSALQLMPMHHPSITRCLIKLARAHQRSFESDGNPSHIDDAISALHGALELTPRSHSDFPSHLEDLAEMLVLRFKHTDDISHLNQAVSNLQDAVALTRQRSGSFTSRQEDLGDALYLRFQLAGDLSDLSGAIAAQTVALGLRLKSHASLVFLAAELADSFQSFVRKIESLLHDAELLSLVFSTEEACASPCGCTIRHLLCRLGKSLWSLYQRNGDVSDLSSAVSVQRLLVWLTAENSPNAPKFLDDLGSFLIFRFKDQEEICDLNEAISAFQRSANALRCEPGCCNAVPQYQCCIMYRVGYCFFTKYVVTGSRGDLDEAICTFQRMTYVDSDDVSHPCATLWLRSLSSSLAQRYVYTRDLRDLSEAIEIQEKVVHRTEDDREAYGEDLVTLSQLLKSRFCEFGDLEDIKKAISLGRMAVRMRPSDPSELAQRLKALAVCLTHRVRGPAVTVEFSTQSQPKGDGLGRLSSSLALDYLNEAVQLLQKAVGLTPPDCPSRSDLLNELAGALHRRFDHASDFDDIEEALGAQAAAVRLSTPGGIDWVTSSYTAHLAELFLCRYRHTGDEGDRDEMIDNYEASLALPSRTPYDRFVDAIRLARNCSEAAKVIAGFDAAIEAAALMIGLDQTVIQRYSRVHDLSGLPLEAAAVACHFDRPDKAVEWLEHGRCIVWGQLTSLRTPLERLRKHDHELATDIGDISRLLERAGSVRHLADYNMPESKKLSLDDEARAHARLSRRWDGLLAKARSISGFESFLKPLPCSALVEHLPLSGNIVIVTANAMQCDAIALVAGLGEPLHIPLADLTISKVIEYRAILSKKLSALGFRTHMAAEAESNEDEGNTGERGAGQYRGKGRNILYVLKALWAEVVKPILDALAIQKADDPGASTLHRIWWCPTGVLSFLPLHAAGIYSDVGPDSECVLDYVVSSYTPSISSLLERVRNDRQAEEGGSGLFLTNQPHVRGQKPLAGTTKEVNSIHEIATEQGIRVLKVEGSSLSTDDCLKYMEEYSSVHFACHGLQSNNEPLKSQLRLEAGALELGAIIQKNLKNADLAFLSACETSTGQEKLDNEVVHLAAGMLAAGYQRVVGTMWEIRDSHAVDVAHDFYSYLMDHREEGSGSRFDGSRSAHALHHAVRQLRARIDDAREVRGIPDELEKSLLLWIPYVHYGY